MDFIQVQGYMGFWSGAVIMIAFHNMFVSIIMYKARQTNASNLLKIIFNFGLILRQGAGWGLYMTPKLATQVQCISILQITTVGNFITRISLAAFLLWRLRQIRNVHNYGSDKWISIVLMTLRIALMIPNFIFQRATTEYVPEFDAVICNIDTIHPSSPYQISGNIMEFLIDLFVSFRLVQILVSANKNASQVSTNIRSKRSLFTAVMYWNFLRLFVSFVFHFLSVLDATRVFPEVPAISTKYPITIILSYVITVDAEIVRVIEGRDNKKGSSGGSAGTEKSLKSIHSPRYDPPKYSAHDQTCSTHSQIDDNKIAIVSMKRLSFFEWANVVVGKRLRKNDDGKEEHEEDNEYNDEDVEEIIDGPSKPSKENDLEKDLSQDRRNSNFSGTTSMTESTLDENPDIVIH